MDEGTGLADYTPLGIENIARQATTDVRLIRCPRDSVVMRVCSCEAERRDEPGEIQHVEGRPPNGRGWVVHEIEVECPACGRRAAGVTVAASS
jgi:hypothetical protein